MSAATQSAGAPDGATRAENPSNDSLNATALFNREQSPLLASQHPQEGEGQVDQSSNIALLATYGINVRDFAYENTLPPVTIVPRFSVQTQPRPRTLKRTRDLLEGYPDGEESDVEDASIHRTWYIDSDGTGTSRGSRYRKKTQALARTLTEPADEIPPSQGLNTREAGFAIPPSQRPASPPGPSQSTQCPITPHRPHRAAQTNSLSPLAIGNNISPSQAGHGGESQETEVSWIDTPLVTPNGSLQWPAVQNTSALPASQLESVFPQVPEDDMTLSQLGFSPERSQAVAGPSAPSPAATPSRRRPDPQLPPPAEFRCRTPTSPTKPRQTSDSPTRRSPRAAGADARPASPRYHLRQRPPGAAARGGATRARSRTRTANQGAARTENAAAAPVRKKQKPSPPADSGRVTRYGRRKNGDAEGIR